MLSLASLALEERHDYAVDHQPSPDAGNARLQPTATLQQREAKIQQARVPAEAVPSSSIPAQTEAELERLTRERVPLEQVAAKYGLRDALRILQERRDES